MIKKLLFSALVMLSSYLLGLTAITMTTFSSPLYAAEGSLEEPVEEGYSNSGGFASPPSSMPCTDDSSPCPKGPMGLIVDRHWSPFVGGSGLISLWRAYMSLDDHLYPSSHGDTSGSMMLGRFAKLSLEDVAVSAGMVTQHEVFGHGWRAREFHLNVSKYVIRPYSGYTVYSQNQFNALSPSKRIAFIAGGMEATGLLAKQLRDRFLETNLIDEREGHLYVVTSLDQTLYVMKTRAASNGSSQNDVRAYVQEVNTWFSRPVLTQKGLRNREMIDFLDPYLWYSLYGIGHYIVDGSQCFEYPMIPLGCYQYLPGFRLALAPYGPEYQFINYVKTMEHIVQATLRYGSTGGKSSEGLILEATRLWAENCLSFDGRFDIWCQPKLFTTFAHQSTRKVGTSAQLLARYRIINNFEIMGQFGYKTTGYMPGFSLERGLILKAGLFVHL